MLRQTVEKLGEKAILAGIDPLARDQESHDAVIGFDTEYDSKTRKLVCFQLAGDKGSGLYTEKLTVDSLARRAREVISDPDPSAVWLITFWSYAELQFLPVVKKSLDWKLLGAGSFDCTFESSDGLELRVFDLARFWSSPPQSLAQVAKSFNYEKLKFDTKRVSKASLKNPRFKPYALRDAELCRDIMGQLRAQFIPLGADPLISKTAPGVSATVFRKQYITRKVRCKNPGARLAGMLACWGGRAEALARGRFELVYEYDLESAYPNAAISIARFPTGAQLEERKTLSGLLDCLGGFGKVIFSFPDGCRFPCLPVVTTSAQLYPLSGVSWATTFELERALELGADLELLEGWGYTDGNDSLARYCRWTLDKRKGTEGAARVAYKLLGNALIGKLAQHKRGIDIEQMREFCETEAVDIHDVINLTVAELETLGIERETRVGTCFAPEWNALITGHVRARLNRILYAGDPVYCATDSVWTRTPIVKPPSDLGLKRQGPAVVIRTRLGAILEGETVHLAMHSLWNRKAALKFVAGFPAVQAIRYHSTRAVKLREALRKRLRLATFLREVRKGSAVWDGKRELLGSGETVPWRSLDAYLQAN